MDLNTLRIVVTLVSLCAFLWIVIGAYRPSRKELLERQALGILEDEDGKNGP